MSLISLDLLWKMFEFASGKSSSSKAEQRKRIEVWLDAVYGDVKQLSELWQKIASTGFVSEAQDREVNHLLGGEIESLSGSNPTLATHLEQFYYAASRIMPAENELRKPFIDSLSALLQYRRAVRDRFDKAVRTPLNKEELEAFKSDLAKLRMQAASLEALITNLKAFP